MSAGSDLTRLKAAAMSRQRLVLFDNDGGDVAQLCRGTSPGDLIPRLVPTHHAVWREPP